MPTPGEIVNWSVFCQTHLDGNAGIYTRDGIAISIRFDVSKSAEYPNKWITPGRLLEYTGQGKVGKDQTWNRYNLGLRKLIEIGSPVHLFEDLKTSPASFKYYGKWFVLGYREVCSKSRNQKMFRFQLSENNNLLSDLDLLPISTGPILEQGTLSCDATEPPLRLEAKTYRIIRDTKKSKKLKEIYSNQCQLCGLQLDVGDRFYTEVHHLRPLGGMHLGLDDYNNMLVLCPNHHVLFDYGVIGINNNGEITAGTEDIGKKLHFVRKHSLSFENVEYYMNNIFNEKQKSDENNE